MSKVNLEIDELEYCIRVAHEDVSQSIVREQLKELIRLATIGKYTEQCFEDGAVFLVGNNDEVENIGEFIGWCEEYIE